jgi:hypothetical protein
MAGLRTENWPRSNELEQKKPATLLTIWFDPYLLCLLTRILQASGIQKKLRGLLGA